MDMARFSSPLILDLDAPAVRCRCCFACLAGLYSRARRHRSTSASRARCWAPPSPPARSPRSPARPGSGLLAGDRRLGRSWRWCTASPRSPIAATRSSPAWRINFLAAGLTALLGDAWFRQGGRTPQLATRARFCRIELPVRRRAARRPGHRPDLCRAHLRPQHPRLSRPPRGAADLRGCSTAPASACACAPSARTRPPSIPPASRSPAALRRRDDLRGVLCGFAGAYLSIAQSRPASSAT